MPEEPDVPTVPVAEEVERGVCVPVEEATWAELIASGRKVNIDIEQFAPNARKFG